MTSEKPILFNTEMVKAIFDGRKTQTRRVVNKEYLGMADIEENNIYVPREDGGYINILNTTWSKYKVGDILWVREPVKVTKACNDTLKMEFEYLSDGTKKIIDIPKKYLDQYDFIKNNCFLAKLNQLHYDKKYVGVPNGCLKEMARIFLKVTNVRVERLQDMKEHDAYREGVDYINSPHYGKLTETRYKDYENNKIDYKHYNAKESFISLWNSTAKNGYKWEDNPYVFVYEFERIK